MVSSLSALSVTFPFTQHIDRRRILFFLTLSHLPPPFFPAGPSSSLPPSPKVCEPVPLPSLDPSGPSSTSPPSSADAFAAQQNPNSPLRSTCNLPPTPPTPSCGPAFQTQALPAPVFDGNFPLGQPLLKVSFCAEEGESSVPPCFYVSPGADF